jgi:hypothetical protein
MAVVFWDNDGMLLVEFLETGVRISSERYVQTFKKLEKAINSKVSGRQDDESSPYPVDTSDIAHSDFRLFVPLKDALRASFPDDGDLQHSFP